MAPRWIDSEEVLDSILLWQWPVFFLTLLLVFLAHLLGHRMNSKYQQECEEDKKECEGNKEEIYSKWVICIDSELNKTADHCIRTCEKWRRMRKGTVVKIEDIAENVKVLNNKTVALHTLCRGIGMGAKFSMFCGPWMQMIGFGMACLADVGYNQCIKHKTEELKKMYADVQRTLQRDSKETREFFHVFEEMRLISGPARSCIKKFHSATVDGFFDDVPKFASFVSSVRVIKNVEEPEDIKKFIKILWKETENLKSKSGFSFSAVLTFNPSVMELMFRIPAIICNVAILHSVVTGFKAGTGFPSGKVMKALNILAIIKDFGDIAAKLEEFDKYPQLSKDLRVIKSKLEHEMEEISEMAREMQNYTKYTTRRSLSHNAPVRAHNAKRW